MIYKLRHALPMRLRYFLPELRFESDAELLAEHVKAVAGVESARVNLRSQNLVVTLSQDAKRDTLEQALERFDLFEAALTCNSRCRIERKSDTISKRGMRNNFV